MTSYTQRLNQLPKQRLREFFWRLRAKRKTLSYPAYDNFFASLILVRDAILCSDDHDVPSGICNDLAVLDMLEEIATIRIPNNCPSFDRLIRRFWSGVDTPLQLQLVKTRCLENLERTNWIKPFVVYWLIVIDLVNAKPQTHGMIKHIHTI